MNFVIHWNETALSNCHYCIYEIHFLKITQLKIKILQLWWTFNVLGSLYIIQLVKDDFLKRYWRTLFEALLQITSYTDFYSFFFSSKLQFNRKTCNHFFSFIFIRWRLITLQYCSGFCHTLTWISHGFTCVPHPNPPSHLPPHPIPLGLPSAPGLRTCLMHPTWADDLFHPL